ncbi:zf-HC2 domain-containing protein [Actinoalloteichus hymeniacidonis]|uniref:Integral membrane protein n=1 Tax=Actinoalloteichus hymeniacidonis TaxID=340345 RepID=A0AAC9MYG8_9PSEU|nr:zf-HC2 domain-containing protein [Actinoalloteichus hymeniacidonis]AOS63255.1 putative integral membrane protein [Actinoalloteichus hymeniacidonis]MBB5908706.1 putative anti-sigma-YlaC factor YlaD [Actinoalloteichus hymeniacidonis]
MECDSCRDALSARLDSELEPVQAQRTDEHLKTCVECRIWQQQATALTRSMRVRPAVSTPDLTERILAAAEHTVRPPSVARVALGLVGIGQLALAIAQLFGFDHGLGHDAAGSVHLLNESTAWSLAIGLGMLWAALRTGLSRGMLPVLGGFVLILAIFSVRDLVIGEVELMRVASHGLLVLGLGLLALVRRQESRRSPEPGRPALIAPPVSDAAPPRRLDTQGSTLDAVDWEHRDRPRWAGGSRVA